MQMMLMISFKGSESIYFKRNLSAYYKNFLEVHISYKLNIRITVPDEQADQIQNALRPIKLILIIQYALIVYILWTCQESI